MTAEQAVLDVLDEAAADGDGTPSRVELATLVIAAVRTADRAWHEREMGWGCPARSEGQECCVDVLARATP